MFFFLVEHIVRTQVDFKSSAVFLTQNGKEKKVSTYIFALCTSQTHDWGKTRTGDYVTQAMEVRGRRRDMHENDTK